MSDAASGKTPLTRLPDGTVKQIGPLTGTRVWTVPGRANRPLAVPRDEVRVLVPGDEKRLCAFCEGRYLETTPEKARLVGPDFAELRRVPASELFDTTAEFRRFGNLFEIVSAEYWRENHGFRQPGAVVAWARDYLQDPAGHEHIERLAELRMAASGVRQSVEEAALDLVGGSHDVVVARRHVVDGAETDDQLVSSGVLTPREHAEYFAFTVRSLEEIAKAQPHAAYVAVFQNWLRAAGASFEHLHKQLVAVDEHGPQVDHELRLLASDRHLYQHAIADLAAEKGLIVAANEGAVAFAGVGHRYPAFEVYSTVGCEPPAGALRRRGAGGLGSRARAARRDGGARADERGVALPAARSAVADALEDRAQVAHLEPRGIRGRHQDPRQHDRPVGAAASRGGRSRETPQRRHPRGGHPDRR